MSSRQPEPSVFISYSWDSDEHKVWVRKLAHRLVSNGVQVHLDQWNVVPGDSLTAFMEMSIQSCDFVLVVCTPNYARKSVERSGGVGYEQQIITGRIASGVERRKFIPIVRSGEFGEGERCAIPPHFAGIFAIDARESVEVDLAIEEILRAVFRVPLYQPPTLGPPPELLTHHVEAGASTEVNSSEEGAQDDEAPAGALARFDTDGWEIIDSEVTAEAHPETFLIPTSEERSQICPGYFAKVVFEVLVPDDDDSAYTPEGERMWIKVIGRDGPFYIGTWANTSLNSYLVPGLTYGRAVTFLPEHVIDIMSEDEMRSLSEEMASQRRRDKNPAEPFSDGQR